MHRSWPSSSNACTFADILNLQKRHDYGNGKFWEVPMNLHITELIHDSIQFYPRADPICDFTALTTLSLWLIEWWWALGKNPDSTIWFYNVSPKVITSAKHFSAQDCTKICLTFSPLTIIITPLNASSITSKSNFSILQAPQSILNPS